MSEQHKLFEKNLSHYDVKESQEDGSFDRIPLSELKRILPILKREQRELFEEYKNGDPLCYPPDWYDQYVFPVDWVISNVVNRIDELEEDDSEEYSY